MKLTFLDIIQKVLSACDEQSVDTASGSIVSEQVGHIVNRVYNEICSLRDWPWLRVTGFSLCNTTSNPNELTLPEDCMTLEFILYDGSKVEYISPEEMAYKLQNRTANTDTADANGIIYTRDPQYYTSYDDETITFDAYDSDEGSSVLPSKCYIQYLQETPSQLAADTDVPVIHVRYHSVLLDGVMADAFNELAQDTGKYDRALAKYEKGVSRMVRWARKFDKTKPSIKMPDYGRNGR